MYHYYLYDVYDINGHSIPDCMYCLITYRYICYSLYNKCSVEI